MSDFLTGVGSLVLLILFISTIIFEGCNKQPPLALFLIVGTISIFLIIIGYVISCLNNLYFAFNEVERRNADIQVAKVQKNKLARKFKSLLEKYIEHETNILGTLRKKEYTNFQALLENFPELKSNETVQALVSELSSLQSNIFECEKSFNYSFKRYNDLKKEIPTRWLIPSDIDDNFEYQK